MLAAGKHILCEKPLATSEAQAQAMADAAAKAGVVNMVNLSYRNVAALQKAAQMVAAGAIGGVRTNWPFLRDRRIDAYGNLVQRFLD